MCLKEKDNENQVNNIVPQQIMQQKNETLQNGSEKL